MLPVPLMFASIAEIGSSSHFGGAVNAAAWRMVLISGWLAMNFSICS